MDYEANTFQYRPGISQSSAQMHRHAGIVSAQQTQDDLAAQEAQKNALIEMLFGKGPINTMGTMSPWYDTDATIGMQTSPYPANVWAGNMR